MPTPIFETKINLIDINSKQKVIFETLSSGERQQAYSVSSLLYHLTNLNSVKYDNNKQRIEFSSVNVILEEIELYFHPDLQRNFVKHILDGLKQIELQNINTVNICIVTHSPFILSDIPVSNILFLDKDANPNKADQAFKTFGANIHDMLKSSFFLHNGAIGEYAQSLLNEIIIALNILNKSKRYLAKQDIKTAKSTLCQENFSDSELMTLSEYVQDNTVDYQSFMNKYSADYLHSLIMLYDEPIIRMALLEEYHKYFDKHDKQKRIEELKKELRNLEAKPI